jgi:hypothetical protein
MDLKNTCNCTSPDDYPLFQSNLDPCVNVNDNPCIKDFRKKYSDNSFVAEHCISRCPLQCNRTEYKTTVNSIQMLGDSYVSKLKKKPNLLEDFVTRSITDSETAKQSVLKVYIFYDPLSYTQLSEHPNMSRIALFATIGGNLSLFLGISALSLFECIEVILEMYLNRRTRRKVMEVVAVKK